MKKRRSTLSVLFYIKRQTLLKNIAEGGQIIATANTGFENACATAIDVAEKLCAGEDCDAMYAIEYNIIDASNIDQFYQE